MRKTRNQRKFYIAAERAFSLFRFGFLKSVTKFFDNDLCLSKIKIDEKVKTIAFDEKNKRLAIMSYERVLYYLDLPAD
jgi:hypothetical protein